MNSQPEFLPFHAINEFMRPDFRLSIIREVLIALPSLSDEHNLRINRLTKKYVKVTGFRNSEKAPALMKVIPMAKSFEKSSELVAALLAAWSELNSDLMSQVYELLRLRGWDIISNDQPLDIDTITTNIAEIWPILPLSVDRTRLPGFYIRWPKGEDYELLYKEFTNKYPDTQMSIDKVSLMVVWLSLRLPYQMEEAALNPIEKTDSQNVS